ncbi:3-oxoacyl-[acyl-carrier-protein] reductase FabG-like [Planococcus citri]|uniref:3-oxoacyl-[acyl-carrier-protein] reductase FabG-like n=1 Tax=Planococcus citri TaxID=170843 RepID=UPI0031F8D584
MTFSGKVILITGASLGIGRATAIHLAELGAKLALTGRNVTNLQSVSKECEAVSKSKPLLITGEMANEQDVKNIIDSTIKHYSRLDVLINNAGIWEMGSIENTSLEQYDRIFNVNVRAVYQLTMLAVPHLIESKGNIINISSICGLRSFGGILAYSMSKSAIDQMTGCVALELASKGVRVNSVDPGVIITDIHKRSGMDDEAYDRFLERAKETHALGRPGNAEEVAKAIAFLASEESSYITGVNLPVDGGRHVMCPR